MLLLILGIVIAVVVLLVYIFFASLIYDNYDKVENRISRSTLIALLVFGGILSFVICLSGVMFVMLLSAHGYL